MYGIEEKIVTRNSPSPPEELRLTLLEGPFRYLEGSWRFKDLGEGCRVSLEIACDFDSRLLNLSSESLLKRGIEKVVDAFVAEVRTRYER